jgi:hypothetical protein
MVRGQKIGQGSSEAVKQLGEEEGIEMLQLNALTGQGGQQELFHWEVPQRVAPVGGGHGCEQRKKGYFGGLSVLCSAGVFSFYYDQKANHLFHTTKAKKN